MKKLFIVIVSIPLIFGCSNRDVDISELKFGEYHYSLDSLFNNLPQEIPVYYNGEKFTGNAVERYGNGKLMHKTSFKGGIMNGPHQQFYINGNVSIKQKMKDGQKAGKFEGFVEEFKKDSSLIKKTEYVNGVVKSSRPVGTINSTSATNNNRVSCQGISDNPSKYIGNTITVSLGYAASLNDRRSLQSGEYRSEEMAFTSLLGIYDGDERYYTRKGDCSGGTSFYLRIPFSIGRKVPNMRSGYITVTGVLKDRNTILVKSISR